MKLYRKQLEDTITERQVLRARMNIGCLHIRWMLSPTMRERQRGSSGI